MKIFGAMPRIILYSSFVCLENSPSRLDLMEQFEQFSKPDSHHRRFGSLLSLLNLLPSISIGKFTFATGRIIGEVFTSTAKSSTWFTSCCATFFSQLDNSRFQLITLATISSTIANPLQLGEGEASR